MQDVVRHVLKMMAGALMAGAAGLAADAVLATEGWWLWGICAGTIAGTLVSFAGEQDRAGS